MLIVAFRRWAPFVANALLLNFESEWKHFRWKGCSYVCIHHVEETRFLPATVWQKITWHECQSNCTNPADRFRWCIEYQHTLTVAPRGESETNTGPSYPWLLAQWSWQLEALGSSCLTGFALAVFLCLTHSRAWRPNAEIPSASSSMWRYLDLIEKCPSGREDSHNRSQVCLPILIAQQKEESQRESRILQRVLSPRKPLRQLLNVEARELIYFRRSRSGTVAVISSLLGGLVKRRWAVPWLCIMNMSPFQT